MRKVLPMSRIREMEPYMDAKVLDYIHEGQIEAFEGFEDFDLIAFDWYDVRSERTAASQMLLYLDREDLFVFCEDDAAEDAAQAALLVPEEEALSNEQVLHRFFVRLLRGDMAHLDRLEADISDGETEVLTGAHEAYLDRIIAWRQELLRRIGLREFEISVPDVEEWYPPELAPEDIVAYISREKSQAVQAPADAIVITADTMVFLDDQRLGKPHDEAEALSMLTALSGRKHKVCTGVTVRQGEKALTRTQSTDVYFREVSRQELLAYIRGGEPMDKAGAYGVQGQGALLVERIDGDFFNVMGLPVVLLSRMLAEFGVTLLA
jgi:septum formation protein